jgi:hypothetical protein
MKDEIEEEMDVEVWEERMRKLGIDATNYFMNNDKTRCMLTHTLCKEPDCRTCQFAFGQTLKTTLREIFPECVGEIEDAE